MDGALCEFSAQGYGAGSVNRICAAQDVSKGIVYHYFRTKDALYLSCVEECFALLANAIWEKMQPEQGTVEEQLERYFDTRMAFFREHPVYQRLFCQAVTTPPAHLRAEIQLRKRDFDALNILLDPIFMFDWGLNMGVEGASLATTVSQFVTFFILIWFYASGRSVIKLKAASFRPSWDLIKTVAMIGIPTAVIQICLSVASSLTNIAAAGLPQSDEIIAAYGVVQRLILIGCYVVMGFMQGYQPMASFAFGAKDEDRFHQSVRFVLKGALLLTVLVAGVYILLSKPLILLFNRNPVIVDYGRRLLISQVALYPAFGLCYMMTITYQTIGAARYGLFLSCIRQGLFYIPFILTLPRMLGVTGIYFSQPAADILTIVVCVLSIRSMKRIASRNMGLPTENGQ